MTQILISGASSGMGRALAQKCAQAGWQVIACGRDQDKLAELEQTALISTLAFDIADPQACQQMLAHLKPDIVVLNAGTCEYVDIDSWDPALFRRVFEVNFFGVVNCLVALLPNLDKGTTLAIVDSLARYLPFTKSQAYGASKAALHYLTKTLQTDLSDRGVKVQSISPGFVKTPLTDKNTFSMPDCITAEQAAEHIFNGLQSSRSSLYFPWRFALTIRLLSGLPERAQQWLCQRMKNQ
ncbi:SDR family NAD(P)-dependent oxidoreductase [Bowmanella pacifica]|uniref:Short-chain dehydrogenase n=1 Tax=Bowmanella pacifica TaxID=502051 RepID=A0A917YSL8_9ALTE|nr:SDR family NAD(P)-dependent oxidoreductase [Bowmanella pacifica]GGO63331.1 short-chain dehydrogenase [Bowmanella pacifica]